MSRKVTALILTMAGIICLLKGFEQSRASAAPKQVIMEQKLGGELQYRKMIAFSSIKVNMPLAPELFRPEYKDGTLVYDEVRSTRYRVNALGERQGPETAATTIAVAPLSPDDPLILSTRPTEEEERRWGWWLAPAGAALMLSGFALVWRRRRTTD